MKQRGFKYTPPSIFLALAGKKEACTVQCWSQCSSDVSHFGMVKTSLRVSADSRVVPIATMRHVARWMSATAFFFRRYPITSDRQQDVIVSCGYVGDGDCDRGWRRAFVRAWHRSALRGGDIRCVCWMVGIQAVSHPVHAGSRNFLCDFDIRQPATIAGHTQHEYIFSGDNAMRGVCGFLY